MKTQKMFDLLLRYEQDVRLVNKHALYSAISAREEITFVIFSCLATEVAKEELVLDFFKTLFFDGGRKETSAPARRAARLIREMENIGAMAKIIPILADTEPRRTWGWQISQAELTLACELMVEEARESEILSQQWHPMSWSSIEASYHGPWTFERCLERTRSAGKHRMLIEQQENCLRSFSDRYYFPLGFHETAIRQVAAYAFEGIVLENVLSNAILLQSERPWKEKDALYQWLRDKKTPLSIVHPFP